VIAAQIHALQNKEDRAQALFAESQEILAKTLSAYGVDADDHRAVISARAEALHFAVSIWRDGG